MSSLRDLLKGHDNSLADRIERLSRAFNNAPPRLQGDYEKEIRDWAKHPRTRALGEGIAGRAGISECAPEIHEIIQFTGLDSGEYNRAIVALGLLGYKPAAGTIEEKFLQGRARAAATVALLLIDPERARESFKYYAQKNPEKGIALAGIGLLEGYAIRGADGFKGLAGAVPKAFLKKIPGLFKLPSELKQLIYDYTRRA